MKFFVFFIVFFSLPLATHASFFTGEIRLKHEYQHFILNVGKQDFVGELETTPEKEEDFCEAEEFFSSAETEKKTGIDIVKIESYLEENIAPKIDQEATPVRIFKDANGTIQFEGVASFGKKIRIHDAAEMIKKAMEEHISMVNLPVDVVNPVVNVEDESLKKMGIIELISVGRSDFSNSSAKRIQNVMAGAGRFNGYLIPKDAIFSFNTQLGEVSGRTGYAKEAIIDGDRVRQEFGGGLCQVSSTAYRGAMLAGLSIVERHNHSFAVNHYLPYGSDATIYQGSKDFRFQNDSPGAILLQTRRGGHNNEELFFHYYGTKDARLVKILGPFTENYKEIPPEKRQISSALPPGKTEKLSSPVRGFDATFLRTVQKNGEIKYDDRFFSRYQARPLWIITGAPTPTASETSSSEVSRMESFDVVSD